MIQQTDLAWLAGVIDSDGNIGFENNTPDNRRGIGTRVVVTNTDQLLIDNCLRIYAKLDITYYCQKRKRYSDDKYSRKPCYDLQVHRLREIAILLEAVAPYMINKKYRAELMLEYCNLRIAKREKATSNRGAPYGDEEKSILAKVFKLNIRGAV